MIDPRRLTIRLYALATVAASLAGCASLPEMPSAQIRQALAPTGKLRVGVYRGSPTSLVRDAASGEDRGVSVDIGKELARRLGVPYEQVEFPRVAAVLEAMKAEQVDFTVTNASPARAIDVNFTAPLVELELGYLVVPGSRVASIADVDKPGIRVGVSQGSTSLTTLSRELKHAIVVQAPTLQSAAAMLSNTELDTFATNKAILFEMSGQLPGAKVLEGRWGEEHLAIAIPKGHEGGMDYVRKFAASVKADGTVRRSAERAGLRGTAD